VNHVFDFLFAFSNVDNVFRLEIESEKYFFKNIVIVVLFFMRLFPFLEERPQIFKGFVEFMMRLIKLWEEEFADFFVLVIQTLQQNEAGYINENISVSAVDLLLELRVFFTRRFKNVGEINQINALLFIYKVIFSLFPRLLVKLEQFYQILVVL